MHMIGRQRSTLVRATVLGLLVLATVVALSPLRVSLRHADAEGVVEIVEQLDALPGGDLVSNPDSARVAALLAALRHSDPVVCELAANSLGATAANGDKASPRLMLDRHASSRRVLGRTLDELRGDDALAAFRTGLGDHSACIRGLSARMIARAHRPGTLEMFLRMVGSGGAAARETGALGLGHLEDPRAITALGSALGEGPVRVRRAAAWALGEIDDPRAVDPLARALRDRDAGVRELAAWALGEIEDPRAVEALGGALTDQDEAVRTSAAHALGRFESGTER